VTTYNHSAASPDFDGSEGLLLAREVAAVYRTAPTTVVRWALAGKLPWLRTPGGDWRFSRKWMREQGLVDGE
jgi:hypothetical protein